MDNSNLWNPKSVKLTHPTFSQFCGYLHREIDDIWSLTPHTDMTDQSFLHIPAQHINIVQFILWNQYWKTTKQNHVSKQHCLPFNTDRWLEATVTETLRGLRPLTRQLFMSRLLPGFSPSAMKLPRLKKHSGKKHCHSPFGS